MKFKASLALIIVFLVVGGAVYYFVDESSPEISTPNQISDSSPTVDLRVYTDDKLGFMVNYPSDWVLSMCTEAFCTVIEQPRQEKITLAKGLNKILIDPLGRIGADALPGTNTLVEEITINNIHWKKASTPLYYRYQAQDDLSLNEDVTTKGMTLDGKEYNYRGGFKFHLYLNGSSTIVSNEEAIQVLNKIVKSLRIIN